MRTPGNVCLAECDDLLFVPAALAPAGELPRAGAEGLELGQEGHREAGGVETTPVGAVVSRGGPTPEVGPPPIENDLDGFARGRSLPVRSGYSATSRQGSPLRQCRRGKDVDTE
jgi:hypothetical protein